MLGWVMAPFLLLLGQGGRPPRQRTGIFGGGEENTCLFSTHTPPSQEWELVVRMVAGVRGAPVQLWGSPCAPPACPADEWEQVGARPQARGARRTTKATTEPEQEEECCWWVFSPLALSFFVGFWFVLLFFILPPPGLLFLAALTKRVGPLRAGWFKRCFSSAAKLGEDEGRCFLCTLILWY